MSKLVQQDYLIHPPVWIENPWDKGVKVRTCFVQGIANTYANPARFPCPDNEPPNAPIDASIVQLIVALHKAGYPTLFCCSGLEEDHSETEISPRSAYIYFAVPVRGYLKDIISDLPFYFDGDSTIRFSYGVDNTAARAAWETFTERVS